MIPLNHARGPFLATLEPVARLGGRGGAGRGRRGFCGAQNGFLQPKRAGGRAAMWGCVMIWREIEAVFAAVRALALRVEAMERGRARMTPPFEGPIEGFNGPRSYSHWGMH